MSIYVNHSLFLPLNPLLPYQKLLEIPNFVMTYDKTKRPAFQYRQLHEANERVHVKNENPGGCSTGADRKQAGCFE